MATTDAILEITHTSTYQAANDLISFEHLLAVKNFENEMKKSWIKVLSFTEIIIYQGL